MKPRKRAAKWLLGLLVGVFVIGGTAGIVYSRAAYDEESPLLLRAKIPTLKDYELFIWRIDFAPGTVVRPHKHAGHEVVLVLEGKVTAQIGTERYSVGPGEVFLVPSETRMAIQNINPGGESKVLSVLFARVGRPLKEDL